MNIWLSEIWRTWRASLRRPGFLLLATGVLALGIGASVAVFALIDAVLLQPLPYPQASQLVQLGQEKYGVAYWITPPEYQHLLPLQGVKSIGLMGGESGPVNIAGGGAPELVPAVQADRNLLPTLGVRLLLGRNFNADEDRPNGPKAVILSRGFWMRRYGGNPDVIGRAMSIEGASYAIVGVLPEGIDLKQGDLLLPLALPPHSDDESNDYRAIARLAPGADTASISAQIDTRMHALYATGDDALGSYMRSVHFRADSLKTSMRVQARPVLMMFLASAALVLLIAWVNLANLTLLRTLSRSHDAAVREALGASWSRRVLPILADGLLVGIAGTVAGLLIAVVGLNLLSHLIPPMWLAGSSLHTDVSTVALAIVLGLAAVLLMVVLGIWRSHVIATVGELREGGRSGLGQHAGLLGRGLVVVQVALATTLLCAAGLFLHALYDAARAPLGFSSQGILTFELKPVTATYPDLASVQRLTQQLLDRLNTQPGVSHVAVGTGFPAGDRSQNFYLGSIHAPGEQPEFSNSPQLRIVGPEYFATFGIPAREGRVFQSTDIKGGEAVAVINQTLARRMYAGHALGKVIDVGGVSAGAGSFASFSLRIVGVISDISPFGPLGDQDGILYLSMPQAPDDLMNMLRDGMMLRFALRVQGNPNDYRAAVVAALAAVAPDQPITNVRSMRSIVQGTTADTRLNLLLVGIFAACALILAVVGMYAVMSMAVAIREREFGVRLALGASPSRLARGVLRIGLLQVAAGLTIGLGLAFVLAGMLRAVLSQIQRSVFDTPVLLTVCLVLAFSGLLACLLPALRASRVSPMRALRGE